MKKYWEQAISFEEYMKVAEDRAQNTPADDEYKEYYDLGVQRMNRTIKTFHPDAEQVQALKNKKFTGKILMISEPWCGDASATVPAVAKFFEEDGEVVRIFLRDADTSLIDQYLTNGTRSIPKVLILNEDNSVKAVWGPRPQYGMELLKKFKANPETYSKEEFHNDLQVYYAKNKGKDTIAEILELL